MFRTGLIAAVAVFVFTASSPLFACVECGCEPAPVEANADADPHAQVEGQMPMVADGETVIDRSSHFDLLAGGTGLREDLLAGGEPAAIVDSWDADLDRWAETRAPYLLYP